MSRQKFWRGINLLSESSNFTLHPHRFIKLCSIKDQVIGIAENHCVYYCDIDQINDTIQFRCVPGLVARDIAFNGSFIFIIDLKGRLYKSSSDSFEELEEIIVCEEARCCPHGFKTPSYQVKFRNVAASEFGCLYTSVDGQLFGSGVMPQIALDSADVKKITFFEGRTVYDASLGSNFAAVISRKNIRRSGNYDTDSDDEEDVFATDCTQCRSRAGSASPSLAPSPSYTCPLGVHISSSTEDNSVLVTDHQLHPRNPDKGINIISEHTNEIYLSGCQSKSDKDSQANNNDTEELPSNCENNTEKVNNIFMNTDAARQFLSRQLTWVSAGEDYLAEYTEKPTRIIKENVSNLTNLVYEGVKTVGDKVATLSRHVSGGSEPCDGGMIPLSINPTESLIYTCNSNYKLDELQFSTSTVSSDKDCENFISEKLRHIIQLGRNILGTELWMWGEIEHGQLGIGDTIKRMKPMMVTSLSGHGLQKISCGRLHCAALTLDGRMFCWGNNRYHQVSSVSKDDRSSPVQFNENSSNDRIKDIMTGHEHTVAYSNKNNIYYMGKGLGECTDKVINLNENDIYDVGDNDEADDCPSNELKLSLSMNKLPNKCRNWRIASSGNITYSYIDDCPQNVPLPDLTVAQHILEEMLLLHNWVIKPFLKKSKSITMHADVYDTACELFTDILNMTALNVLTLLQFNENHIILTDISIIKNCDLYIHLYRKYLTAVCNMISISGFSQIVNVIVEVPSNIQNLFSDQLPPSNPKNKKNSEAVIGLAFTYPLIKLNSYKCILKSLFTGIDKNSNDNISENQLSNVLSLWDSIFEEQEKKRRDAEITKLFWETTGKVLEQYKTPERRLIRESRSRPLSMMHAGRFSSHWFVLLNDVFLHISGGTQTVHPLPTLWIEPAANTDTSLNVIQLITPEETMNVSTSTSQEKTEWVHALQTAVKVALHKESERKPPAVRSASYTFTNKSQVYKDAKFHGRWLDGKIHGHGRVEWPDGKVYVGQFQQNCFHGQGKMDIPNIGVYEGQWKDNLQNGYGIMKYTSGDVYEGHFKDGLAHGHGVRRQGDFTTSTATIYLGEWSNGQKHGYGVMDDIGKGEKYLGSWSDNKKHGCGLIVTLDGIYYEGVFMQDVLTGHGVMIFEDNTHYEGEFRSAGVFSGKGVLTFSSGDKIEGSLHGAWTEGVKISNAILQMNISNPAPPSTSKPNSFGKLCVAPNQKWNALFRQCNQSLGIPETLLSPSGAHFATGSSPSPATIDNRKIWRNVAVALSSSHKSPLKLNSVLTRSKELDDSVDCLEVIPHFGQKRLDFNSYVELKNYIHKACETSHHPLGQLVLGLTNAFNTTYGGVRVHPLLLSHAVKELQSITSRLYRLVRLLFPALPADGHDLLLSSTSGEGNPGEGETVSAASLLQPTLLPRVHPSLFVLYALTNKTEDDLYWRRLMKWNRQPDLTLMAFLGIDQKFWMGYATREADRSPSLPPLKEQLLTDAVETLQQLKTTFSPIEKLLVIRSTFERMTATVQQQLGASYVWSMDELFPVFQFVVVRARILQLGSELGFVEDFLEPALQRGELAIMFTTLKACYFQILQEKLTIA